MSNKSIVWLTIFICSTAGSYLPKLWGGSLFSFSSVLLGGIGGIMGLSIGLKIGETMNN